MYTSCNTNDGGVLNSLFPPPHPDAIFEDEEEQTYEEFVNIGKRKPNRNGTGRFKLTSTRNKIGIFYFGKQEMKPVHLNTYLKFLEAFFCLEVDYIEQFDAIDTHTNTFTLDLLEYDITTESKAKRSTVRDRNVDVFSLFDVLIHRAKTPYFSIVGLFDCVLTEDKAEVLGRACGNRVACVSLQHCLHIRTLISTTCHELLHTMGFDHCTSERCVMNAIGVEGDDWLFLSLVNLKKLQLFHKEMRGGKNVNECDYHRRLHDILLHADDIVFKKDKIWLERVVTHYRNKIENEIICIDIDS